MYMKFAILYRVSRKLRPQTSDLETSDLEKSDLETSDPLKNDWNIVNAVIHEWIFIYNNYRD